MSVDMDDQAEVPSEARLSEGQAALQQAISCTPGVGDGDFGDQQHIQHGCKGSVALTAPSLKVSICFQTSGH